MWPGGGPTEGGKLSSGLLASAGPSAAEQLRSLLIPCAKTNTAENVKNHRVTQSVRSSYGCRADRDEPAVQEKGSPLFYTLILNKRGRSGPHRSGASMR